MLRLNPHEPSPLEEMLKDVRERRRDLFAAAALAGTLAKFGDDTIFKDAVHEEFARDAWAMADRMLEVDDARKEREGCSEPDNSVKK